MTLSRVELREGGFVVRPWRTEDAAALHAAGQDPVLQRWNDLPQPFTPEQARSFVTEYTETSWNTGVAAPFGAFEEQTGRLVGSAALDLIDPARAAARLTYWVAPWARGRGVATTTARAVARWALGPLGLERLEWSARVGDHASRVAALRIGVSVEGLHRAFERRDGRRLDVWVGGLLPGQLREDGPDSPAIALAARRARLFLDPQPRLVTPDGLVLRSPRATDRPVLDEQWAGRGRLVVEETAPRGWSRGDHAIFVLASGADGPADVCLGSIEVWLSGDPATSDVAEVGYIVAEAARGRGHATAALLALTDWAFAELGVRRLEWRAVVGNEASRRVAVKAGFTVEGTLRGSLRDGGDPVDAWFGARLATDPPAARLRRG